MSEVQEAQASSDVEQATNPAQDVESQATEDQSNDNDEQSPEAEVEEVKKTPEELLTEAQSKIEEQEKAMARKTAAYRDLQKAHDAKLEQLRNLEQQVKPPEPLQEPKIDDFDSFEDFQKARDEFVSNTAKQKALEEFKQSQLQAEQMQLAQERDALVKAQETEYLNVNPRYMDSKANFESYSKILQTSPAVEQAIVEQAFKGSVPQLIDYFGGNDGQNLDKLREIASMSPVEAGIEIYKIQQSLKAPERKEVKPAPPPANKPKGGGAPKKDIMQGDVLKNLGLKK